MRRQARSALALLSVLGSAAVQAGTVYFNDFETDATAFAGLSAGGTLGGLGTTSLPTDGAGIHSSSQSHWLGRLGEGVPKSSSASEVVTLQVNGLAAGATYTVGFDLYIGSSWDGSASFYGNDTWSLHVASGGTNATLVDATFSNCGSNICGAYSPQTYSNANPTAGVNGPQFGVQNDAAVAFDASSNYPDDYAIYYFGHGAGPTLSFVAGASSATFTFARGPIASGDSGDEFWALDNVRVASPVPLPAPAWLLVPACAGLAAAARRRRG